MEMSTHLIRLNTIFHTSFRGSIQHFYIEGRRRVLDSFHPAASINESPAALLYFAITYNR